MKKLIALLFIVAVLAVASQAAVTVGTDLGYLLDTEEEYLSARAGFTVHSSTSFTQQIELEVGYTNTKDSGLEADLLPVTLNYRFTSMPVNRWGYTLGAGAGFARTSIDGVSIGGPVRLRDESLALQAFAGVTYQATERLALNLGAKYLWIDDAKFAGSSVEIGDDVALSAGLSFKF